MDEQSEPRWPRPAARGPSPLDRRLTWDQELDDALRPRWDDRGPYDTHDEPPWREPLDSGRCGAPFTPPGAQQLTRIAPAGDRVVDVVREPVMGSDYACLALELEGAARALTSPGPPGHEVQLAWRATIVGGVDALASLSGSAFGPGGYHRRQSPDVVPLGSPHLLLGVFRRQLVARRDIAVALRDGARAS